MRIPHRVGRRTVGSIPAVALLTKAPGDNNAQYESVLAFPLCRGLFATAKFSLTSPARRVRERPGRRLPDQGHRHEEVEPRPSARGARPGRARGLSAAGSGDRARRRPRRHRRRTRLPRRSDGRDRRRLVRGRTSVARAKAATDGSYRLAAPRPGTYRVEVALTVTGKGGSATRRDARAASVVVR